MKTPNSKIHVNISRTISAICFILFSVVTSTQGQWTAVNVGIDVVDMNLGIPAIAISGNNIFLGTRGGVFLSTNNGSSWTAIGLRDVGCFAISGNNIFAGTFGEGVFLSTNNGTSWTAESTGLTSNYIACLAISGSNFFAEAIYDGALPIVTGLFLSTDNGTSWAHTGLTDPNVASLSISGNQILAGTLTKGILLSTDNGASWTASNAGLPSTGYYPFVQFPSVQSLARNGDNIFAGTYQNGVFLSTDNGASWNAVNTGLTNTNVHSFAVSGGNIFAGTSGGVFLSRNSGTSWAAVNAGLPKTGVLSLAIGDSYIFAGTDSAGVWSRPLSDFSTTITAFTPTSGLVGTTVTITGTNFDPSPSNNSVKFNGTNATVTASQSTSITTSVPAGATAGQITVTANGQTATSSTDFTVLMVTGDLPMTTTGITHYPNPVEESLTIEGIKGEVSNCQLYDVTGRASSLVLERNDESYQANVQHLLPNIYLIRLTDDTSVHQIKFVKK